MAEEKKGRPEERDEVLVRILGKDIPAEKNVLTGLTRIKGCSWSMANATCINLGINKRKKISELEKSEIEKIEKFLKNPDVKNFLKNRRRDFDSGEDKHLMTNDLDLRKDFDIKRLKKIKSYRGLRHSLKLPVRGQRTRSNFRKSGIAVGVKKPKMGKKS
ncbi:30S ribosomal protein S13 [Candidatus Pacearchaeota archaeon CG10_big_fil_rev_8_21_14_0_10_35_219]|nr:30S ribosomal protein S13 [Candidatus Pacearchaeota archaeon]OIO42231.1 MAG: 30S ribosomal protein S13 [Candidatus Pacearchaeota archaeon CG1_02_35_32]PIO07299.1 MAG: 30S ribosomal protein S13 [Candidatus Pacearchaeota archaeon CG10_big_fil_rev_8_21_14_0_10_35_219]PIY81349.1 MAG: 30S ribosomal protein S13 [Candidatus Pacearchaeota archaeon CG_4_10_14_0_8_um_filter_35_169]PIZ79805.1 MAG: 30S ribosomal protein S13 [Candidatus Pacearchaeota archaeon CG_4_10_14_0_2_um_filter_35_33]PJA69827.1 MA